MSCNSRDIGGWGEGVLSGYEEKLELARGRSRKWELGIKRMGTHCGVPRGLTDIVGRCLLWIELLKRNKRDLKSCPRLLAVVGSHLGRPWRRVDQEPTSCDDPVTSVKMSINHR
jgi:hypothetical protein